MARKTFISYKYNESCKYRDKVIESLGDDATYYTGETADSPDISNLKVDSIKNHLKDMIFNTTVTMVILSPSLVKSNGLNGKSNIRLASIQEMERHQASMDL